MNKKDLEAWQRCNNIHCKEIKFVTANPEELKLAVDLYLKNGWKLSGDIDFYNYETKITTITMVKDFKMLG